MRKVNITCISHRHIGDTIMIEPALQLFNLNYISLKLIVKNNLCQTVAQKFNIKLENIDVCQNVKSIYHTLKKHRPDIVILFDKTLGSAIASFFSKIPLRYGYNTEMRGFFLTQCGFKFDNQQNHICTHILLIQSIYQRYLKKIPNSIKKIIKSPNLFNQNIKNPRKYALLNKNLLLNQEKYQKNNYLSYQSITDLKKNYILLQMGTTRPSKNIPTSIYFDICRHIKENYPKHTLYACGDDLIVANILLNKNYIDNHFVQKTSFQELCFLIDYADLLITPDTGPMHISSAYEKKTLAVFGSTNSKLTAPLHSQTYIVKNEIECSPCLKNNCLHSKEDLKYMKCYNSNSIIKSIDKILN